MKVTLYAILSFFIIILISCKTDVKRESSETGFKEDTVIKKERELGKDMYYRYPSSREMLNYINLEKLSYRPDLVNPVDNLEKYHNTRLKTLNLGVYLADLSYMILFDKTQNTEKYFNAIFNLTSELRIQLPDEQKLVQRIKDNLYNSDSLLTIAEQYHTKVIDFLRNTGQEKTLAVISTGSYIEGMYLSLNLVGNYDSYKETVRKIVEQKHAFKNLTFFAQEYEEDQNVSYSLDYLDKINSFFDQLPLEKKETKVSRSKEHNLVIEGGEKVIITNKDFKELKSTIDTIRAEIVHSKMNK